MINSNQTVKEARALINLAEAAGGVNWSFDNEVGLVWGIPNLVTPVPTQAEVDAEIVRYEAEDIANAYQLTRRDAYAKVKEQLDQLYHDMAADKGDKTGAWFAAVKAVKDKYPKP